MANFGTTQRIPTTSTANSSTDETYDPKDPYQKLYSDFKIACPFNIPMTREAAAIRIIRNLVNLGLYYALFVWIILFITLIPERKVSLILLVIMTYVTTLYLLLLRAYPNSFVLHKVIDKRFVLALLAIATCVQLIVTRAGIHLAVTLACSMPLVMIHAVLWISDDQVYKTEEEEDSAARKLIPVSEEKSSGAEDPEMV